MQNTHMVQTVTDCIKGKGRHKNNSFCPICHKVYSQKKVNLNAKQDFFGNAPNVFVGKYGYPNVNVGLLGVEQYNNHDNPLLWSKENYQIPRIVDLRTQLVNSNFNTNIKNFNDKFLEISQEVSMSKKPVDVEINLDKKPNFRSSFNQVAMPHGPRVKLKKAQITENPKIPRAVDKAVSDSDWKAADALKYLHKKELDEHYLTKIFSVGNLGVKTQRKLVPTRWSITAVDDTLGKQQIDEIKKFPESDYLAYFGGYLGNYYLILCFPDVWSYELFETVIGERSAFGTDYESYDGRKTYADNTAGGYYAARLAILERLMKSRRQSSVLALRFITPEYWAPLGVWVVREASRNAMNSRPINFASEELMLNYARLLLKKKFNYDLDTLLRESKLYNRMKTQLRLRSFF